MGAEIHAGTRRAIAGEAARSDSLRDMRGWLRTHTQHRLFMLMVTRKAGITIPGKRPDY